MKYLTKISGLTLSLLLFYFCPVKAQDSTRISITTGVGLFKAPGNLGQVLKPAIAFNTGLELNLKNNWFTQGEISFNTLGYDQKYRDESSSYLFSNSNSSLLQIGAIGGKDFSLLKDKWLIGSYIGTGFLNIGQPRLTVDVANTVVRQEVIRNGNIYGKAGARFSFQTKSPFFQTLYVDGSYFISPQLVQTERLNGFTFFIGSKFSIK
jgi:hypothetical protein